MQSFLARNGEGKPFVVKMMDAKRAVIYRVLAENPGPYIANVYSVEEISDSGFIREDKPSQPTNLFMAVTEYAGECTLERYVVQHGGKLGEAEALGICKMLCAALIIPHEIGIVHRDIKPENIMVCLNLTNGKEFIKLIDFGSSKVYDQSRIADTTIVGSYGFQAPESLTSSTDARTDIYSIGCVLRYMLTGAALGQGDERDKVRIGVQEIIDKCTNVNPAFRYQNVDELIKILRHELHEGIINSIPIIREIPGFRTQTPWKMTFATVYYAFMVFWICIAIRGNMLDNGLFCVFFWCFLPLFICGNVGHVYRLVPRGIRENNQLFLVIRVVLAVLCFFIPITVP